jgi:hypothetical protein
LPSISSLSNTALDLKRRACTSSYRGSMSSK